MEMNGYYLPESCISGSEYYLKIKSNNEFSEYERVIFLSYRPHPGEVLVMYGNRSRMVYRSDLFTRQVGKVKPERQID